MEILFTYLGSLGYLLFALLLWIKIRMKLYLHLHPRATVKWLLFSYLVVAFYYIVRLVAYLLGASWVVVPQRSEYLWQLVLMYVPFYGALLLQVPSRKQRTHIGRFTAQVTALCVVLFLLARWIWGLGPGGQQWLYVLLCAVVVALWISAATVVRLFYFLKNRLYAVASGAFWLLLGVQLVLVLSGLPVVVACLFFPVLACQIAFVCPFIFKEYDEQTSMYRNYRNMGFYALESSRQQTEQRTQELYERMETYLKNEKPYLNPRFTRAQLASEIQTNATYVSRIFNDKLNKTFTQHMNSLRIRHAMEYFRARPQSTVADLCVEAGFQSLSAFTIAFKTETGLSPGAWCKQQRDKTQS